MSEETMCVEQLGKQFVRRNLPTPELLRFSAERKTILYFSAIIIGLLLGITLNFAYMVGVLMG